MALPAGFIDELRGKVSLAEMVSKWLKWDDRKSNPAKGDYWASCPFHDDDTSSFHVDDKKGYYYCFACHAKGDVLAFLKEKLSIGLLDSVALLCAISSQPFPQLKKIAMNDPFPTIIELKDFIVENFESENFLEIGVLSGWSDSILKHPRLLRSLNFGDPDYSGCVLELLSNMERKSDGSILKVRTYIEKKFSTKVNQTTQVMQYGATEAILGYKFQAPRNDVVAVMMPFSIGFGSVYDSIKDACNSVPIVCKRADEVWNSSILINDIFELINHAAVVVCDLTGRNENVFYELGVAHAWAKKVIPITQNATDVPFDLRHHRFLTYLNNGEGLKELSAKLIPRLRSLTQKT